MGTRLNAGRREKLPVVGPAMAASFAVVIPIGIMTDSVAMMGAAFLASYPWCHLCCKMRGR